jgi:pimeloyl-ACP methyl ester carboxylesterase
MKIIDVGQGQPVVLVPGIQGRWEWMKPAVDALARRCRVLTFSLADERTCGGSFDARRGFDCYVDQIRDAMDQAGIRSATICGVSYGGLIAAAFAARHPESTSALALVSALPPSWRPDSRVRFYLRAPRLLSPLFCIASLRLYKEIAAATPGVLQGVGAAVLHGITAAAHLFSPTLMARRARSLEQLDLTAELKSVRASILVITGEPHLDRVVPVALTREYLAIWPHARLAMLRDTGHLGLITKPAEFADLIATFVEETHRASLGGGAAPPHLRRSELRASELHGPPGTAGATLQGRPSPRGPAPQQEDTTDRRRIG